jgi:hypothetical protein
MEAKETGLEHCPSAVSVGNLALVSSSSPQMVVGLWEMPAPEEPTTEAREALSADGAPSGTTSIEVDGASPQPGDDIRGSFLGLVMRDSRMGVRRSTAPGDASPSPRSLYTVGLGVSGLLLLSSPRWRATQTGGGRHRARMFVGH